MSGSTRRRYARPVPPPPPLRGTGGGLPDSRGWDRLPQPPPGARLRVDWPKCRAHGLCHEMLPETVGLDEWGYPVLASGAIPRALVEQARRAAAACPTLALRVVEPVPVRP